ncbi:Hypothetical predicted protein [Pelobates cultripes]|uniref:Uncharacterized protein n=1 Tax=Pelobates cultripes TaxID=61616 RepID=A0AAD1RW70_PELCU|nr:Hypothetical predicted protein [Pelobates cultripes]
METTRPSQDGQRHCGWALRLLGQQTDGDWAAAFQTKFNTVCWRFWERLEKKSQPPAPTIVKTASRHQAPSRTKPCHSDAPSTPQKQANPGTAEQRRSNSPPVHPQALPVQDNTSRQHRGGPFAALQRSFRGKGRPTPTHRTHAAALRVHPSLPH